MNSNPDAMIQADIELQARLTQIFDDLDVAMLPDAAVERIHSFGMAEDGSTFCVMCDMVDGTTMMVSICPGLPVTVARV